MEENKHAGLYSRGVGGFVRNSTTTFFPSTISPLIFYMNVRVVLRLKNFVKPSKRFFFKKKERKKTILFWIPKIFVLKHSVKDTNEVV